MDTRWLNVIGLAFALLGAVVLALGLLISKRRALQVGSSRLAEDSDDKNICLPHVHDRLREARFALIGAVLLFIGFLLQIIASWPQR